MTIKGLIKDLMPPMLWRWFAVRNAGEVHAAKAPSAAVHLVRTGPLRGLKLLVNDVLPAFREMVDGTYDHYLWSAMPDGLKDGIILDIGAHIGYHTLGCAARFPNSRVVAFEPNPINLKRLQENLDLNPEVATRIQVLPVALSDVQGSLAFRSSSNVEDQTSSGGYLERGSPPLEPAVYERSGFSASMVPTERLDDLIEEYGWKDIRIMKIDVEGAEHLVLKGALSLLARDRPALYIEVHSVVCMLEVLTTIGPLGYVTRLLHEDRSSRCFIAASVPSR